MDHSGELEDHRGRIGVGERGGEAPLLLFVLRLEAGLDDVPLQLAQNSDGVLLLYMHLVVGDDPVV